MDCNADDLWDDDETLWDNSSEEVNKASDLDREWQRRRNQFHTVILQIHCFITFQNFLCALYVVLKPRQFLLLIYIQIGYRDGIIAGKEASAQEGFNIGFKESVLGGYKWGLVRGIIR